MGPSSPRAAGQAAEQQALDYLQAQGLRVLHRNWLSKGGELDLVMLDGDTVVFVEVRYRLHAKWGGALGSIDARKQARLIKAAQWFLQIESHWQSSPCRFDVIALEGSADATHKVQWLSNAFDS
ncbi:YraN family protein [Pseudomonas sp. dw_358]|uniref:YraN family protein n=1 Tax=Pseudomonas sp. dw_358 TaxID=2720083 RepID=UPI001BD53954|nr:YraN family protein [Pseudomonas sp. dw_358]